MPSPQLTSFRIGWDNSKEARRYNGRLDEIAVLEPGPERHGGQGLFESGRFPMPSRGKGEQSATAAETGWLRAAAARRHGF